MKYSTIICALVATTAGVDVTRMVSLEDVNDQVSNEFEKLSSDKPSTSDFRVEVSNFGTGASATCKNGDTANVNYTGKLQDGRVFDTNMKSGLTNPFKFTIGASEVIKCWDTAMAQMHVGEKATITCPPNMAYGEESPGGIIGPNATLNFDIEVVDCTSGM